MTTLLESPTMITDQEPSLEEDTIPGNDAVIEKRRMSFGDHLEELRSCLIRAMLGIVVASAVCLIFGKQILSLLFQPLFLAQTANGLQPNLQVLAPTGAFSAYLKIAILSGLILSMPWVIYQLWMFVASGLYSHERRFVKWLAPASIGLFALGVSFLYYLVLPAVLHFFITFNRGFDVSLSSASSIQSLILPPTPEVPVTFAHDPPLSIPVLSMTAEDAKPGQAWIDPHTHRLIVKTEGQTLSVPLELGTQATAMQSQFAVDYYVSFVLTLALAFGVAFETPIVVFFLAWSGLVTVAAMSGARRYVILAVVVVAAVVTPPDVISQLTLAVPMYVLFEVGLRVARIAERAKS